MLRRLLLVAFCAYVVFDVVLGEAAVTYKQPIADVRARLETVEAPPLFFDGKQFKLLQVDSRSVVWIVEEYGKEGMRFTARLAPAGADATAVKIDVSGPGDVQRRLSEHWSVRHMYIVAVKEQVAATLGDRIYNWAIVAPTVVFAVLTHLPELSAQMDGGRGASRQKDG